MMKQRCRAGVEVGARRGRAGRRAATPAPGVFGGGPVRQLLGRKGEVWGAESAADKLIAIRAS